MDLKDTTTTKRKPAAKRASNDSAAEIARHISAILNHPETPVCIYDALRVAMNDLGEPKGYYTSVEYIAAHLAANIEKGGEADV